MNTKLPFVPDWSHYVTIADMSAVTPQPRMAITKCTEGNYRQDETFLDYWRALKANGIPRGAYHFFVTTSSGVAQANYFIKFLQQGGVHDDDLLVVDLEVAGISAADLIVFLNTVEATYRNNVIILYSRKNILESIPRTSAQVTRLKQYSLWLAWYPLFPDAWSWITPDNIPASWGSVVGWQYSENGKITGAVGKTDMNVFTADFLALFPQPFPPEPPADIVTEPHDGMTRISGRRHGWKFELFVTDPSKFDYEVICSDLLTPVSTYAKTYHATLAVNGGEWNDREPQAPHYLQPKDYTVSNGKVCIEKDKLAARPSLLIQKDNSIIIDTIKHPNDHQALTGVIWLIQNSKISSTLYDTTKADNTEGHSRTIFGKDKNGFLMCFLSEGVYPNQGMTHLQTAELFLEYGAVEAFFGSGGGDGTCVLDGISLITPENINSIGQHFERALPSALLIFAKGEPMTDTAVSTTHDLSLRPLHQTINSSTIVSILRNTTVPVLETWKAPETTAYNNKDDFWVRVSYKTYEGWVGLIHLGSVYGTYTPGTVMPPPAAVTIISASVEIQFDPNNQKNYTVSSVAKYSDGTQVTK